MAAKALPDGYTLLLGNSGPVVVNPILQKKLAFDPQRDLVPVAHLVSGQIMLTAHPFEVLSANIAGSVQHVRSGRARAIAVSSAKRAAILPEVPTIAETYPGYDLVTWMGISRPQASGQSERESAPVIVAPAGQA